MICQNAETESVWFTTRIEYGELWIQKFRNNYSSIIHIENNLNITKKSIYINWCHVDCVPEFQRDTPGGGETVSYKDVYKSNTNGSGTVTVDVIQLDLNYVASWKIYRFFKYLCFFCTSDYRTYERRRYTACLFSLTLFRTESYTLLHMFWFSWSESGSIIQRYLLCKFHSESFLLW